MAAAASPSNDIAEEQMLKFALEDIDFDQSGAAPVSASVFDRLVLANERSLETLSLTELQDLAVELNHFQKDAKSRALRIEPELRKLYKADLGGPDLDNEAFYKRAIKYIHGVDVAPDMRAVVAEWMAAPRAGRKRDDPAMGGASSSTAQTAAAGILPGTVGGKSAYGSTAGASASGRLTHKGRNSSGAAGMLSADFEDTGAPGGGPYGSPARPSSMLQASPASGMLTASPGPSAHYAASPLSFDKAGGGDDVLQGLGFGADVDAEARVAGMDEEYRPMAGAGDVPKKGNLKGIWTGCVCLCVCGVGL